MGSLWPKLSKHYQEGEISAGLYPKEGDNFKLVNMPAVYRLNDGKRRKYVSDTSFYKYPSNPAFDTPYEDGGILICDKAVVFSIPIGDFMPYKPGGVPKKYYHKSLTESFFISFFRKDKLKHFLAYAVLALFFLLFLQYHSNLSFTYQGIVVLVLGTSVGIIIELMQFEFIPGRDKELLDMVLNSVGLLAGIFLYQGLFKTKFRLG
jgi:hypothetical protein